MRSIAFEVNHRVHEMFEGARPGDGAFFGDMADEKDPDISFLGFPHQPRCTFPDLSDGAGSKIELPRVEGLDGVYRDNLRGLLFDDFQQRFQ